MHRTTEPAAVSAGSTSEWPTLEPSLNRDGQTGALNPDLTYRPRYWTLTGLNGDMAMADVLYFALFAVLGVNGLVIILAVAHAINREG
jgi:hypothetical protein